MQHYSVFIKEYILYVFFAPAFYYIYKGFLFVLGTTLDKSQSRTSAITSTGLRLFTAIWLLSVLIITVG